MSGSFARTFTVLAVALAGLSVAARAEAECFTPKPQGVMASLAQLPSFQSRSGQAAAAGTLGAVDAAKTPTIVGLWHVLFTTTSNDVGIPSGAIVDNAYVTWHSDGTELMNSARPPVTGSFCMGVWTQVPPRSYRLKHIALAWNSTGTEFVGPAIILEDVRLGPNDDSYEGTFTIDQYAADGTTRLAHIEGTLAATRITP
jgi:hypothetical protein